MLKATEGLHWKNLVPLHVFHFEQECIMVLIVNHSVWE
jgi:hypothetical protein